ncbi:MAG: hypothetical protein JF597_50220 [Streptomyces sp.]|jgi:hypothetical protein|uniref:hypothetical protein n=1 Tax=Streptomyces sp. TaxID=1931 RepID=UPI0025E8E203|nr:hypothetical protein [Streptomyces sp.]MBW8801434.1 hypothetical protein [Streptomyces sp.]
MAPAAAAMGWDWRGVGDALGGVVGHLAYPCGVPVALLDDGEARVVGAVIDGVAVGDGAVFGGEVGLGVVESGEQHQCRWH